LHLASQSSRPGGGWTRWASLFFPSWLVASPTPPPERKNRKPQSHPHTPHSSSVAHRGGRRNGQCHLLPPPPSRERPRIWNWDVRPPPLSLGYLTRSSAFHFVANTRGVRRCVAIPRNGPGPAPHVPTFPLKITDLKQITRPPPTIPSYPLAGNKDERRPQSCRWQNPSARSWSPSYKRPFKSFPHNGPDLQNDAPPSRRHHEHPIVSALAATSYWQVVQSTSPGFTPTSGRLTPFPYPAQQHLTGPPSHAPRTAAPPPPHMASQSPPELTLTG